MSQTNKGVVKFNDQANLVIIMSVPLDSYRFLPFSVRKDLGIAKISSFYLDDETNVNQKHFGGLQFSSFLGRSVDGYYTSPNTLVASDILTSYNDEYFKGMNVIQLVPEFGEYRRKAALIRHVTQSKDLLQIENMTDDQLAQYLSEEFFLNVMGLFMSMRGLRNNPLGDESSSLAVLKSNIRDSDYWNARDTVWKTLSDLNITYGMLGATLDMTDIANGSLSRFSVSLDHPNVVFKTPNSNGIIN